MGASLNLVHATRHRWRYRVVCAESMDWRRFSSDLTQAFPSSLWSIRLNEAASSLVVVCKADAQSQPESDVAQLVWLRVRAQLIHQGIDVPEIPLSPTEIVEPTMVERLRLRWLSSPARWLVNGLSLSLSLSALLTSLAIFVLGFIGLFLPLSPGFWLLMLASIVFDLAINIRRPFVEVA